MADPFVAEIRIFAFNFPPKGWAFCDGQLLPISQNTALFSLLGTTYGGDGKSTFALPDMQGNAPMHPGQGPGLSLHDLGEIGGSETVTCFKARCRRTRHPERRRPGELRRRTDPDRRTPWPARRRKSLLFTRLPNLVHDGSASALAPAGGDQPHNNMMPYLTLNFCIALQGVFPPRG